MVDIHRIIAIPLVIYLEIQEVIVTEGLFPLAESQLHDPFMLSVDPHVFACLSLCGAVFLAGTHLGTSFPPGRGEGQDLALTTEGVENTQSATFKISRPDQGATLGPSLFRFPERQLRALALRRALCSQSQFLFEYSRPFRTWSLIHCSRFFSM